jgi:hypothetical protein
MAKNMALQILDMLELASAPAGNSRKRDIEVLPNA